MRRLLYTCLAFLALAGRASARPDCPSCPNPSPARPTEAPRYEWRRDADEPHWFGLFVGKVQVGAFNARTQRLYLLDPVTDEWIEAAPRAYEQLGAIGGTEPQSNGVIRGLIKPEGERFSVNGERVTPRRGRGIIGKGTVPDDSKTPSLTLIGPASVTGPLRQRLESSQLIRPLMQRFLLQEFEPSNPLVKRSGFVTDGKPTIYAEMPDGRTLFRLDEYPGDQEFIRAVMRALDISEGVRKPDADYNPAADRKLIPDLKPQVNAEVNPAPFVMILTHALALIAGVIGGGGAALGGGLVFRRLLGALIAAELAKLSGPPAVNALPAPPANTSSRAP